MNDVNTTVARKLRSAAAALRADAAESYFVNLREALLAEIVELEKRADVLDPPKPAIEEPTDFGSIVRAGYDDHSDRVLWVRTASGWYAEVGHGFHAFFVGLHDPEVLRVGVGDNEAAYNNGVSDTVSALVARLQEKRAGFRGSCQHAYDEAIKIAEAL